MEPQNNGHLTELGRYQVKGEPVKYLAVPEPGKFALLQVGGSTLHIVDLADLSQPRLVLEDTRHGLIYGYQLCDQLLGGRYAAAFWHVSGLHWYDLQGDTPVFAGQHPEGRFDALNGIGILGTQMIAMRSGGLVRFDQSETRPLDALPVSRVTGNWLSGKLTVSGQRIALANRALGDVFILDASDLDHPKLVEKLSLEGNPGRVVFTNTGVLIPAGYQGLIKQDFGTGGLKATTLAETAHRKREPGRIDYALASPSDGSNR